MASSGQAEMPARRLSTTDLVSSLQTALRKCKELHDDKCHVTTPKHIPDFWVIDTQENCLVSGNSVNEYVALSYVWSSPPNASSDKVSTERLMLQRNNMDNFRTPGFLSSDSAITERLPEVIRDSMNFVQQSGVRYLWVDCLCIPQNDESTGGNVLSMKEIYSRSHFTIIAAAHASSLYGSGTNIEKVQNAKGVLDAGSLHGALLTTHWATRGWTFQEQMLSNRSLVFLDETVFWDCLDAVWCLESLADSHEMGVSETSTLEDTTKYSYKWSSTKDRMATRTHDENKQLSHNLITPPTVPNFRTYRELICRYNHRDLTYAEDALPAISGVLDALACGFPGGFISGLPAVFLDSALLWQPLVKAKKRIRSDKKREPSQPLPSWSWVGWQCRIDGESLDSDLGHELRDRGMIRSNLDAMRTPGPPSQRPRRLVNWASSTTVNDDCPILKPGIREKFKELRDSLFAKFLPDGWSCKTEDIPRSIKWYSSTNGQSYQHSHVLDTTPTFRYPLPMPSVPSTIGSQGNNCFISCTTYTAKFNVRRVLHPHQSVKLTPSKFQNHSAFSVSVFDTQLYNNEPDHETYCPVITLEDNKGRWAGLLRVMDHDTEVKTQQTVEVIAISKGTLSRIEAALRYEETVDRLACYRFRGRHSYHCHFALTGSFQKMAERDWDRKEKMKSECYRSMEKEAHGVDHGPFFLNDIDCRYFQDIRGELPKEWEKESYDFYNVLWIARRDTFVERIAAGRVPRDIWEQNQGRPEKIRLG